MTVTFEIPRTLRPFTSGESQFVVEAPVFRDALAALLSVHPNLRRRILTASGDLYAYVGIFVNDAQVSAADAPQLSLRDGDVVRFVPAMAGG